MEAITNYVFPTAPGILVICLRLILKRLFNIRLEVVTGVALYGAILIGRRSVLGVYHKVKAAIFKARYSRNQLARYEVPEKVAEYNRLYRMSGLEVVLGLDNRSRPIKVDLEKMHTLLAGITGSGKTTILNGILSQILARPEVRSNYHIYLLDLKSSKRDYLRTWKPVVDGYYGIDEKGSTEEAIAALNDIVDRMQDDDKRIFVIIDELAMLTDQAPEPALKKSGEATMRRISSQIRDRGALLVATQRPHYQTIPRNVSGNLERKVCMRVDDLGTAQMILRTKKQPSKDVTAFQNGEFIIKEGSRERVGRSLDIDLPGEIDTVVMNILGEEAENDIRLQALAKATAGKKIGNRVHGVNKILKTVDLTQEDLKVYYRNYVMAGAFDVVYNSTDGSVAHYTLAVEESSKVVRQYIKEGKWKEAPEKLNKNGNMQT